MARRRFQRPTPKKPGAWWTNRYRQDVYVDGKLKRIQREVRIAPASLNQREAAKIADERLMPMNQGIESHGSAKKLRSCSASGIREAPSSTGSPRMAIPQM